jgi:PTS system cellobiose-specific IIC component
VLLVIALLILDLFLYLPFFKMFEKQLLEQEQPKQESEVAQPGKAATA